MTCLVKKSTIRFGSKSVYKSSPIEAILQGIYIKSYPGGQLKKVIIKLYGKDKSEEQQYSTRTRGYCTHAVDSMRNFL